MEIKAIKDALQGAADAVGPHLAQLGAALDVGPRDAVQLVGVAVISLLGAHAITQGDMRR